MRKRQFIQGIYKPEHPQKYKGTVPIVFRSGLELSFMRWCDRHPNVLFWGSESVVVPYVNPTDGKVHRYFVDNHLTLKVGDKEKKYLVEIKPSKQTQPPSSKYRKKQTNLVYEQAMYATNLAKWEAAKKWAEAHGFVFQILTEKDLR